MILRETFSALVRRAPLDASSAQPQWRDNDGGSHTKVAEVWRALNELHSLLVLLREADSCVQIRLLIKLYHVGASTLGDVLASLVNEILDLGYPERDISLDRVTRNRHVRAAGLTAIVKSHTSRTEMEQYAKIRNDIVHRNTLFDPELDVLEAREADLASSAALFYEGFGDATPEAYFARESLRRGLAPDVRILAIARANRLTKHLSAMKSLIQALDEPLSLRIARKIE